MRSINFSAFKDAYEDNECQGYCWKLRVEVQYCDRRSQTLDRHKINYEQILIKRSVY